MKSAVKFNWMCAHCGKRNITKIKFQFDIPKSYHAEWDCSKCGKDTMVSFSFGTRPIFKSKDGSGV